MEAVNYTVMVFGDSRLQRNAIFVDSYCCPTSFKNEDSSSKFCGVCNASSLQHHLGRPLT